MKYRAYLLHVSHYDPKWCSFKENEWPFDASVGMKVVDAMAEAGMNSLVVDVADGVKYRSHPELERHYSVPMKELKKVCDHARKAGIDVVPKLNFSKSSRNRHDEWMQPHTSLLVFTRNAEKYWSAASDLIGELCEVCRPENFFHIGMDEDHYRSLDQFTDAIERLRLIVRKQKLRTMIWSDAAHDNPDEIAQVHAQKCKAAEKHLSKDIVQILWDYYSSSPSDIRRLRQKGFEVWAAPGRTPALVSEWKKPLEKNGGTGLLMTQWVKCSEEHESEMISLIQKAGPSYL